MNWWEASEGAGEKGKKMGIRRGGITGEGKKVKKREH